MMIFQDQGSQYEETLQQAAGKIGLTIEEMADLLESGLEIDHLLDYISAVKSKRMN
jgi:hypothetical protein